MYFHNDTDQHLLVFAFIFAQRLPSYGFVHKANQYDIISVVQRQTGVTVYLINEQIQLFGFQGLISLDIMAITERET